MQIAVHKDKTHVVHVHVDLDRTHALNVTFARTSKRVHLGHFPWPCRIQEGTITIPSNERFECPLIANVKDVRFPMAKFGEEFGRGPDANANANMPVLGAS
jgi:hypothetical protein